MTGQWREMFEPPRSGRPGIAPPVPARDEPEDDGPPLDLTDYKPWLLQRSRSRPTMLLNLRRFESRSGMWMGWALSYPALIAVEYIGERMLSLDFGVRQFMIEGDGLGAVVGHLQHGSVVALQEYNAEIWPGHPTGPLITSIRRLGPADASQ